MKKFGFSSMVAAGAMFLAFSGSGMAEGSNEAVAAEAATVGEAVAVAVTNVVEAAKDASAAVVSNAVDAVAEAVGAKADEVSVLVDKKPAVMKSEVDSMVDSILKANAAMIPPEGLEEAKAQIRKSVIDQLTIQAILERECDKAGIKVDESELEKLFAEKSGGAISLEEAAKESGMDRAKFNEFLIVNFRIEKLLDSKIENLPPFTDAELKARFDEIIEKNPEAAKVPAKVSASHILILIDGDTTEEQAKEKIEEIRKKALDGADFGELAKEYSECPSGKRANGSLGSFGQGQMVKEFEDAAFAQEVGVVGEPVKTEFGYHIVKVDSKEPAKDVAFEDVKDDLLNGMTMERQNKIRNDYIRDLHDNAQIENLETPVVSEPVMAPAATAPESAESSAE